MSKTNSDTGGTSSIAPKTFYQRRLLGFRNRPFLTISISSGGEYTTPCLTFEFFSKYMIHLQATLCLPGYKSASLGFRTPQRLRYLTMILSSSPSQLSTAKSAGETADEALR